MSIYNNGDSTPGRVGVFDTVTMASVSNTLYGWNAARYIYNNRDETGGSLIFVYIEKKRSQYFGCIRRSMGVRDMGQMARATTAETTFPMRRGVIVLQRKCFGRDKCRHHRSSLSPHTSIDALVRWLPHQNRFATNEATE